MTQIETIDLKLEITKISTEFSAIDSIYIFGSRRYKTDSIRSDIDLISTISDRIKISNLREYFLENCTAIDLFVLEGSRAISVANESFVEDKSEEALLSKLGAVKLFSRSTGFTNEINDYSHLSLDTKVKHKLTTMPHLADDAYETVALTRYFRRTGKTGLPVKPFLGRDADEATQVIIGTLSRMIQSADSVTGHGQAQSGWTSNIKNEADFQNLFWIVIKPWLPSLSREEVEITYDGNKKISDFNLFNNQVIVELKHIKDSTTKRNIVKTLKGLSDFYKQHPNVRVVIFGILVEKGIDLDEAKWESDYSYFNGETIVKTKIVRNSV